MRFPGSQLELPRFFDEIYFDQKTEVITEKRQRLFSNFAPQNWLGCLDSNQEQLLQRQSCYHYTTSQRYKIC